MVKQVLDKSWCDVDGLNVSLPDPADTGAKAPLWRLILIRALFFPLMYLPLIYSVVGVWAVLVVVDLAFLFRADRRALHDLAAGTRVVRVDQAG